MGCFIFDCVYIHVIDNNMNLLKWILLAVCVLKVVSFTLCLILNPDAKEIDQFFKSELFRKYNAHSMDKGYISVSSEMIKAIARDSIEKYLRKRDAEEWPTIKRMKFQDYAKYLRSFHTITQNENNIDLNKYPKLLRNTVAEENAKREIYSQLNNLDPGGYDFKRTNLIGLLTGINIYPDSMQVRLVPFEFATELQFDSCVCRSKNVSIKNNPFIYAGSLSNWKCTFQHPKTMEIQVYDLKTVE